MPISLPLEGSIKIIDYQWRAWFQLESGSITIDFESLARLGFDPLPAYIADIFFEKGLVIELGSELAWNMSIQVRGLSNTLGTLRGMAYDLPSIRGRLWGRN